MSAADDAKKKAKEEEDKPVVDPAALPPDQQEFFEWLETLFFGETQFPEKLEVRIVSGKDYGRLGPLIKQYNYSPDQYKVDGKKKPTKESIVKLAREIYFRVHRDTDIAKKKTVYGVFASHFAREVDFYERWLLACEPRGTYSKNSLMMASPGERPGEDDDEETTAVQKRMVTEFAHLENMSKLYIEAFGGLMDRLDRSVERSERSNELLRARYERQQDITERALSLEADREDKRAWRTLGIGAAERGITLGMDLLPPFLNKLAGKTIVQTKESLESIALKKFFKRVDEGGALTTAQSDAAFGVYVAAADGTPTCVQLGVLSFAQGQLLWNVAQGQVPADALDQLLPGGELAITPDQLQKLQGSCGFALEQIGPIGMLIGQRMQAKAASAATTTATPT